MLLSNIFFFFFLCFALLRGSQGGDRVRPGSLVDRRDSPVSGRLQSEASGSRGSPGRSRLPPATGCPCPGADASQPCRWWTPAPAGSPASGRHVSGRRALSSVPEELTARPGPANRALPGPFTHMARATCRLGDRGSGSEPTGPGPVPRSAHGHPTAPRNVHQGTT